MKLLFLTIAVSLFVSLPCNHLVRGQNRRGEEPLTNAAVVKLAKAGFKEKTIISVIFARIPNFDLSPDRMIELKRNGVTEKTILAMLERQEGSDSFDDSWGDDSLSSGSSDSRIKQRNANDGTNIFGSSGEQESQNRTNGANGSSAGQGVTTGTATVRIIRPPAEAGAVPKLEKTKSLTNDSIIELVEAGFSEGTIIRRIEQSPVDFDLSAKRIDELRKHRVSEKIVAAMKIAMGGESTSPPASSTSVAPKN